jgi:rsbT co-antagonist protein RsbR
VNPIDSFAEYLIQNAESISREIVDYNIGKLDIEIPAELVEKSIETNKDFLIFLGHSLEKTDDVVTKEFIEWHKEHTQQSETRFGLEEISSLIKPYAQTRLQLVKMITQVSIAQGLSTEEVVFINNRISYLMDLSISEIIIERERFSHEMNQKSQQLITELSTPIVPIQNGIAVLPLIGEFNTNRSDHIINKVIPKICDLKIEDLIIDFSGIVTINNEVANHILNIYKVLEILGVRVIFTGIRPDISEKIVHSGINFPSLKTFGTVQQAILSKSLTMNTSSVHRLSL